MKRFLLLFALSLPIASVQAEQKNTLSDLNVSVLSKLASSCGVSLNPEELAAIGPVSISESKKALDLDKMEKNIKRLKQNCNSVKRYDRFYVCKTRQGFSYYSANFDKLTKKTCDQVVVDNRHAYCFHESTETGKKTYLVSESHVANSEGGATCMETFMFSEQEPKGRK